MTVGKTKDRKCIIDRSEHQEIDKRSLKDHPNMADNLSLTGSEEDDEEEIDIDESDCVTSGLGSSRVEFDNLKMETETRLKNYRQTFLAETQLDLGLRHPGGGGADWIPEWRVSAEVPRSSTHLDELSVLNPSFSNKSSFLQFFLKCFNPSSSGAKIPNFHRLFTHPASSINHHHHHHHHHHQHQNHLNLGEKDSRPEMTFHTDS